MKRKLPYVHRVFLELNSKGLIRTTNPRKIGEREIGVFDDWMNARNGLRSRPLGPGYQRKLLQHLNNFLTYVDNGVIERMVKKKLLRPPRELRVPKPSFGPEEKATLLTILEEAAVAGSLKALGVFGHAVFCGYAGTRLKEVRLAEKGDYDERFWELTVFHPKGEGVWADPRVVRVCPPGRGFVADFLGLRERELRKRSIEDRKDLPLVPSFVGSGVVQWPDSILHNVKCGVEKDLGLRFDFRKLRRSYGQNAFDTGGVRLEAVSRALGHASVVTAQRSYVRTMSNPALDEIDRAYESASVDSIRSDCEKARCPK